MSDELSPLPPQPVSTTRARAGKQPGLGLALLVVLLATLPLVGLMYLGHRLLNLAFVPFDLYDWPIRVGLSPVSYTHLRAHETKANLVCRLLL